MPSNHLIICHPLLLLPSIFPSIRVFSNESALRIRWPEYWSFSFSIRWSGCIYSFLVPFPTWIVISRLNFSGPHSTAYKGRTCMCLLMSNPLWPHEAHQAPLSMGFSRQEYWSGLPFPPPEDLPNPGIEPTSLAFSDLAGRFFTTESPVKPTAYTAHEFMCFDLV